ncbi:hypothetical protein C8R43DRAFT_1090665 [Mycena crocata]|nr:hypothetical protein C8R43DRAFT_1090665 [Mycena crocata]
MNTSLTRVALVTGAAHGIGRAIALRLAADGLDVAVDDLPENLDALNALVHEIEGVGRKAFAITSDVSKEEDVRAMVELTVSALSRLDVMIANAGVGGGGVASITDANIEDWEKRWEVNIRGTLLCYKYAARQMITQGGGGKIIGASSICGIRGYAGVGGYCVSKAAVRSLTQTAALELREHGINVNAYAPGVIETSMNPNHNPPHSLYRAGQYSRTGQPSDVAAVVSFLASPESSFITGECGCIVQLRELSSL